MNSNSIVNIERAILSTMIFDPKQIENVVEILRTDDFYHPFHKIFFKTILDLLESNKPIDEEFIKDELLIKDSFDEIAFLDIFSTTPIANIKAYIKEIKEHNKIIKIKEILLQTAKSIDEDNQKSNNLINFLETNLEKLQKNEAVVDEDIDLETLVNTNIETNIVYSTGLNFLDEVLGGGFEMGQLITITGEQESGKTQLVNQILFNIANGFECLYFSLEFNKRQLIEYTRKKIKTCNSRFNLKNIKVVTDEMTTGDIDDILAIIKQKYRKFGTKFVAMVI